MLLLPAFFSLGEIIVSSILAISLKSSLRYFCDYFIVFIVQLKGSNTCVCIKCLKRLS